MGKKSVRANKNIYQLYREEKELTREKASELMEVISPERIEKIESEKSYPHPDEILVMAEVYKKPDLYNYYCTHECPIGMKRVPQVVRKDLSQITVEVINSLNVLNQSKNRFVEITVDGQITKDEVKDFEKIKQQLEDISSTIESLKLWLDEKMMESNN